MISGGTRPLTPTGATARSCAVRVGRSARSARSPAESDGGDIVAWERLSRGAGASAGGGGGGGGGGAAAGVVGAWRKSFDAVAVFGAGDGRIATCGAEVAAGAGRGVGRPPAADAPRSNGWFAGPPADALPPPLPWPTLP